MSAPGSVELNEPDALLALFEIGGGEASHRREAVVEGTAADQ